MSNWLEKWRGDAQGLSAERQRMNQALARLEKTEVARNSGAAASLAFILDLTSSRNESLCEARLATTAMFDALKAIAAVSVKPIYYRGRRECKAGQWQDDPEAVSRVMQRLSCAAGFTQIARALRCVLADEEKPSAVVFIGDHCEDDPGTIAELGAALGKRRIPVFVFHECRPGDGGCEHARPIFNRLAEASGGAYSEFHLGSAGAMQELLSNVAAFSAAGAEGLKRVPAPQTPAARQLQERLLLLPPPEARMHRGSK